MNSEETLFTPDHVERAVLNMDPANGTLSDYLTKAQLSTSAWTFVWTLLKTDKHSEVQLYGANTLHLKISKHWQEVPADFVLPLQNRLFHLLSLYSDECHRIVYEKLCLCLSCFILKTLTRKWSGALFELVASVFNPPGENPKEKSVCQKNLIEILRTIPEVLFNSGLPRSEENHVIDGLLNASNTVYELINRILVEDWPEELKEAAIKCFKCWCDPEISNFMPEDESLLINLLNLLKSQKHTLETADALVQFFEVQQISNNSRVMKCLQLVTELGSIFDQQPHNIDLAQNLTKIFVSAAENNMELMLSSITLDNEHSAISLDLLQLILRTVSIRLQYPTEELCSNLSLEFWSTLRDMKCRSYTGHKLESYPPLVEDVVTGLLVKLIEIFITKIRYPPENLYNQWSDKDKELFLIYRVKWVNIVRITETRSQLIERMVPILKHQLSSNLKAEWQDFESIFFIINEFKIYNYDKLDCISEVYTLLSHITCDHLILTKEILKFVGSYAEYTHDKLFDQSMARILNFFNQKSLLASACKSLKYTLVGNITRISRVSEMVIQAVKQAMERPDIEHSSCETLAYCLGIVGAHAVLFSHDLTLQVIQVVLMPHINVLCSLAAAAQVSNQDKDIGIEKLKLMSSFFSAILIGCRTAIPYGFIIEFLTHILHYVGKMITSIVQNEVHMREVFTFLEMITFNLDSHFQMMVPKLCEIVEQFLHEIYSLKTLQIVLDLARIMFVISKGRQWEALKPMYLLICEKSLQVIGQNLHDNTDLVETMRHFMDFMCDSSREAKELINLDPNCLLILFRTVMRGVEMENLWVSDLSFNFLKVFVQNNDLIQIVKTEGQRLLEILLLKMDVIHDFNSDDVEDVFMALLDKHRQFVVETLTLFLCSDQFQVPLNTQNFLEQFLKAISDSNVTIEEAYDAYFNFFFRRRRP